jgi:hypothetical protein
VDFRWPLSPGSGLRPGGPFPRALGAISVAAALLTPVGALAQTASPAASTSEDDEDTAQAAPPRPPAPDTRTGHLLLASRVGFATPIGRFIPGTAASDFAGPGVSIGGMLGVGLSRYAVLEVTGGSALLSGSTSLLGPNACAGCNGRSFDVGLGLSYRVAQGMAVDPWVSFGLGYRFATFSINTDPKTGMLPLDPDTKQPANAPKPYTYQGLDFARIALGADFYPLPALGFGPYIEADIGTRTRGALGAPGTVPPPPDNTTYGPAVYAFFHVGLRIALDPFRSGSPSARPASARR